MFIEIVEVHFHPSRKFNQRDGFFVVLQHFLELVEVAHKILHRSVLVHRDRLPTSI